MRPVRGADGSMTVDADGNPTAWEVLPFADDETYNRSRYSGAEAEWAEYRYQDIGNLTAKDFRLYTQWALRAIGDETL